MLYKTLHRVSDKGVGEHVGDVEKVLRNNVGGAAEVKLRQLICLGTMENSNRICKRKTFWDISKEDSSTGTWNKIPGAITDQRFLIF